MNFKFRYVCLLLSICLSVVVGAKSPKYIFFFIGDGMGFSHVEATQLFCEGGAAGKEHQSLIFTTFPVVTQVSTQSASHLITCSSAAATALSCGEKTTNYVMGMDKDKSRKLNSITHQLKAKGYKIGIITSSSIDHATPGGFYASQPSRKMYYEIGQDAANSNFDFFAGAGLAETKSKTNPNAVGLYDYFKQKGYSLYRGMEGYNRGHAKDKILLFPSDTVRGSLKYAMDRNKRDMGLPEITKACIDNFTTTSPKGFYMMVEGARIDWAAHAHDAAAIVRETIDFDNSIRLAYDFYLKHPDETLILVVADHETGGLGLGIGTVNLNIDLLKYQKFSQEHLTELMREMKDRKIIPSWTEMKDFLRENLGFFDQVKLTTQEELELLICYENSFLKKKSKDVVSLYAKDESLAVAAVSLMNKKACLGWTTSAHTAAPVPLYVLGKQAQLFSGRRDNTDLPNILRKMLKL